MLPRRAVIGSTEGSDQRSFDDQSACERGAPAECAVGVSAGRASVRIAVPDRMIRMTEFGLRFVRDEGGGSRWWARVAERMETLVSAHLPHDARSVEMSIEMANDSGSLEVVLQYDAPRALTRT